MRFSAPVYTSMPRRAPADGERILCHFSCGAASAVATKLAIAKYGHDRVDIVRAFIVEEHEDNERFQRDCERWLNHPITVLRDERYGASTREVWRRERYIKGMRGASCTRILKRGLLAKVMRPEDIHVLGYTEEEVDRADDFIDWNPGVKIECPLIDAGLRKRDCLAMIERAGILLPAMYRLGFNNNNCRGCPKGGKKYWAKIRRIFPEFFYEISDIQEEIGPGAYFLRGDGDERMRLRDLPLDIDESDEPEISCSFWCDMAEQDIRASDLVQLAQPAA